MVVEAADARTQGGTGLGLAISRSIVEQHDGRLWAESDNTGSTFRFTLRRAAEQETAPSDPRAPILICDDDPGFRALLSALLERNGHRVSIASSGAQAVAMAVQERPMAMLLDVVMPGMDGWDTMSAFKGNQHTRDVPIVFLTCLDEPPRGPDGIADRPWLSKPSALPVTGELSPMRTFEIQLATELDRYKVRRSP
jgi:CheY-like chemotaxis protein